MFERAAKTNELRGSRIDAITLAFPLEARRGGGRPRARDATENHVVDIGWNRVVAGVHYPSDILAGRVLGQAIVREMRRNPQFIHDLAEVKAELATVPLEPAAARP